MREQFEKLPRVKPILRLVKYSESSDGYDPLDQKSIYEKYADWLNGAWYSWQARVPEGYKLVPVEPSADLVNHGHQVFLGHFNEGGQTGGRSLYFAYKAMIEAQENKG